MNTLQIEKAANGSLIFADPFNGKLYHPSDEDGIFINLRPEDFEFTTYVTDGTKTYPINFFSNQQLGWLTQAINAVAQIGSSIIGSNASKKANASAEKQLQLQQQIQQLAAQTAERQAALQIQSSGLTTPEKIGIGIAAVGIIGTVIYLFTSSDDVNSAENEKKFKSKQQ